MRRSGIRVSFILISNSEGSKDVLTVMFINFLLL